MIYIYHCTSCTHFTLCKIKYKEHNCNCCGEELSMYNLTSPFSDFELWHRFGYNFDKIDIIELL